MAPPFMACTPPCSTPPHRDATIRTNRLELNSTQLPHSRIHRHQLPRRLVETRVLSHERREARLLLRRRDGALEAREEFADCDAGGWDLGADFFAGGEGGAGLLLLGCWVGGGWLWWEGGGAYGGKAG